MKSLFSRLLPGAEMLTVRVQTTVFDIGAEAAGLSVPGAGAVVTFTGLVRELGHDGALSSLELEHYPGMTEKALQAIGAEATERWKLLGATIIHRVGPLHPNEPIVFVGAASAHRQEAFAAAEYMMDYLKTRAPFWKKETGVNGDSCWVEAKSSDDDRARRWAGKEGHQG